ncbi:MAG: transglycosylase SLT domain-containing protein, partial [Devosiaceae bacterium]|nr:transglycosylase SLT domain-containing protein [Devosiaceae bacterium MH13]
SDVQQAAQTLAPLLDALEGGDGARAYSLSQGIADPLTRDLGLWLIGRFGSDDVPLEIRTALRDAMAEWPGASVIARQTERAIADRYRGQTAPSALFGASEPRTAAGQLALARALKAEGQTERARQLAAALWRSDVLDDGLEAQALSAIGDLLSQEDHRARAHWLLYRDRITGAERLASYLTAADRAAIEARARAIRQGTDALGAVRAAYQANPENVHLAYELARLYRRADRPQEAANVLLGVRSEPDALLRTDLWWRERRIVARDLIEVRQAELGYRVAEALPGGRATDNAEAAFTAGWIALRFLNDPARAERHFRQILEIGSTPITRSRGYYWLGRSLSAAGDETGAQQAFAQAVNYGETFYGQAAATLSGTSVRFDRTPGARAPSSAFFRYADILYAMDRRTDARIFLYAMARAETDPAAIVAMAELAAHHGDATSIVQIGKIGAVRHRSLATLGYPTGAFPSNASIPDRLPQAVAYAIARQESGFDARARSRAGALGLMQLMPETARRVARQMGVSHSTGRLTSDPAHNVSLGSFHLDELIADYDGSYILTFIAYNAGPGRVPQWIERFGDPRGGQVDVIDWIELIPFSETRSYVQRVLENIYVYQQLLARG